jgi:hypothetical protein
MFEVNNTSSNLVMMTTTVMREPRVAAKGGGWAGVKARRSR